MLGRELGKVFPVSVPVGLPAVEGVDFYISPDVPDKEALEMVKGLMARMGFVKFDCHVYRVMGYSCVFCEVGRRHVY